MAKFQEAEARKYRNVFVCKRCKQKIRGQNLKILAGKVKCRRCGGSAFRPIRKK